MQQRLTLFELNQMVSETIELSLPENYWVEAELSDIQERGHCYMELVEKEEKSSTPIARARAICWSSRWLLVKHAFERITGQSLRKGMKLLLKVKATFHEAYGFSYQVSDIDPAYTLGDMVKKRQEIIRQLKEEGVFDLQKELSIPMFANRIAVISSETAAGYGDFCRQLTENEHGFVFSTTLFPAVMQGEAVERSIVACLNEINANLESFDVVVIIRGGGASADLSGFDTLTLAENVANFPLPIITGIGHERDESILDMVSNTRVKTPTAAGAFLIDSLAHVLWRIEEAEQAIMSCMNRRIDLEKARLKALSDRTTSSFRIFFVRQTAWLEKCFATLESLSKRKIAAEQTRFQAVNFLLGHLMAHALESRRLRLRLLEGKAKALDPINHLKKGYSITLYKGKTVRDAAKLKQGEEIQTILQKGKITSIIQPQHGKGN